MRLTVNRERDKLARCRCCNVNFELASGSWFVANAQSAPEIEAPRLQRGEDKHILLPSDTQESLLRHSLHVRNETIRTLLASRFWRLTRPLRLALDAAQTARWFIKGRHGDRPARYTKRLLPPVTPDTRELQVLTNEMTEPLRQARMRRDLDTFLEGSGRLVLPMHQAPVVSVILVLHNRAALTLACLTALKTWIDVPCEVVVVDDGSTDETPELLARTDGARILKNSRTAGFSRACNQAAAASRGASLLLLGQEAALRPGAVAAALRLLAELPDAGAVGGPGLAPDGKSIIKRGRLYDTGRVAWDGDDLARDGYRISSREADFATRAFLMTPRHLWDRVGGLDEAFEDGPYAEADYCLRLRRIGRGCIFDREAAVTMNAKLPAPTGNNVDMERSRTLFQAKHLEFLVQQRPDPQGDRGYALIEAGYSAPRIDVPRPRVEIYWHFNEACNFRCSYCFRSAVDHFRGQEHPACGRFEPEELAARFKSSGFAWKIVFTVEGGWNRFSERFRYLRQKGFAIRAVYVTHPSLFDRMERDLERLRSRASRASRSRYSADSGRAAPTPLPIPRSSEGSWNGSG